MRVRQLHAIQSAQAPMPRILPVHELNRPSSRRPRSSWGAPVLVLVALGLVFFTYRSAQLPSHQQVRMVSITRTPEKQSPWKIQGLGQTREDAEQDALEKARQQVIEYLDENMPQIKWTPSLNYIREHLIKEYRNEADKELPELGKVRQISLQLQVTPEDQKDMVRQDRQFRTEDRMLTSAKFLSAVVALLALIAGYIRLDELGKGYYTTWLRMAGVGVAVASVTVFLWMIVRLRAS